MTSASRCASTARRTRSRARWPGARVGPRPRLLRRRVPALGVGLRAGARRRRRRQAMISVRGDNPALRPEANELRSYTEREATYFGNVSSRPARFLCLSPGQDQRRAGLRRFARRLPDEGRRLVRRRLRRSTALWQLRRLQRQGAGAARPSLTTRASRSICRSSGGDRRVVRPGRFQLLAEAGSGGMGRSTAPATCRRRHRRREDPDRARGREARALRAGGRGPGRALATRRSCATSPTASPRRASPSSRWSGSTARTWRRASRASRVTIAEAVALARARPRRSAYAHARGIVHRDIKPENLFLPGGDDRAAQGARLRHRAATRGRGAS